LCPQLQDFQFIGHVWARDAASRDGRPV
jgi:hypothetical protein